MMDRRINPDNKQEHSLYTDKGAAADHAKLNGIAVCTDGTIIFADGSHVSGSWSIPARGGMQVKVSVDDLSKVVKAILSGGA